jgi:hypothetical protein
VELQVLDDTERLRTEAASEAFLWHILQKVQYAVMLKV